MSASRVGGLRSSSADNARTVSTSGRRRSPRSSALTALTERPAIVASSSCVKPAASRSALSCAPNDPEVPCFMARPSYRRGCTGVVRVLCGCCGWLAARSQSTLTWQATGDHVHTMDSRARSSSRSLVRSMSNALCPAATALAIGESFDQVVLPHLGAAYRLARWLMRDEHDAEDVVQEASLRAFRYFRTFTGGNGRAWFLRIVRNTCRSWHDDSVHAQIESFDEERHGSAPPASDPEMLVLQTDDVRLIERAMRQVPDRFRVLL